MGTIVTRKRANGSFGYTAQIVIKKSGEIIWREAKTFDRKQAATNWLAKRETELKENGPPQQTSNHTLADAIDKFTTDSKRTLNRTKEQVLRTIKTFDLAGMPCAKITSQDIVQFAEELSADRLPQTVGNYMSHLSAIFAIARPAWGYPLDQQAMEDAQKVMKRLRLTAKSKSRDRRPTLDELDRILSYYKVSAANRAYMAPMDRIIAFAIFSTRRQDEIVRIKWSDLDEEHSRILVRDMKNPGETIGNDVRCDLPEPALAIIKAMPKTDDERIFPYGNHAISAWFTRTCASLGIKDLRFHDLRHEGISLLFEMGNNIPHVAAVSGHRSWQSLNRYTHIRETGDKYEGWKWLEVVTKNRDAVRWHV